MYIKKYVEDLEIRIGMGEFEYLKIKYPTVAFNTQDAYGRPQDRNTGKNILLAQEGYITVPNNYNPDFIKKYDVLITYNSKYKELHPELNICLQDAPINWENYYELDSFLSFDEKIKGVCSLAKVYNTGAEGDINFMKHTVMRDLKVEPDLCVHTYGPVQYGRPESYKGYIGYKHSHYYSLKKINEYLFNWCSEPIYHELWGWNYVTERLFNCFKSKTVAIYYGCYNIQDLVPTNIFIDYRNFKDIDDLSKYLIEFSKDKKKYTEMVENAFEWNKTCKLGDIELLEDIIQDCVQKYKI